MDSNISLMQSDETRSEKISGYLWITFIVCLLSNIFAGIVSMLMPVYLPVIVKELLGPANADSFGHATATISSLYVLGWAVGGFTWGFISDKIGRSRSLIISVASYSIFSVLIGFSSSWEMVILFRFLSGFAVGGLMVISPTLLSEVWPASSRSIILGIDSIGFPIGIFSSGLVTYFISDWRRAFLFAGSPLILALSAIWILRESTNWKSATRQTSSGKNIISQADKNNILKGSIIFGSMLIGLWALFSWIPTWVQSILTSSDGQKERGLTMMLLGAGGLTGGFISGWVSNTLGVRKSMLICFGGCFIMSIFLFGTNSSFSFLIYAETGLLSLFFGMSQGLLSIYIPQMFAYQIRATATGFCFNAGRFVTAAAVFFVGTLVMLLGGYGHALLVFSLVFVAGFITLFYSQENSLLKK
jgi:predicted MFS family arabinose efflux permease